MIVKYEILVENIIDSLDASVFNGDLFFNQENREDLRNWMSRWEKQLKEYDEPLNMKMVQSLKVGKNVLASNSPVFGEGNIKLKLDSCGDGYYFTVSQEDNSFEIDYKEIIALKEAADILLKAVGGPPND